MKKNEKKGFIVADSGDVEVNGNGFMGTQGSWVFSQKIDRMGHVMLSIHQEGYDYNYGDYEEDTPNENLTSVAGIWSLDDESMANAKLIASAPDLLKALILAEETLTDIRAFYNVSIKNNVFEVVRKAIKRAI